MILIENKTVRRRDKRFWYLLGMVFVAVFVFSFLVQRDKVLDEEVGAANLAKFDPGYIISDYQMSNYNSMNESEIQAFLKSKNSCNDTNLGRYTAGEKVSYFSEMSPPRTWHIKDGHFVCMADETFDGGTAAHIIYQAAQDYRINPQVLLVLLEKEQSLVRDTFPHSQQYRSATGYGCPDTAACSSKYYGLQNQIRNAAALFRTVLDGGWTNYPLGENYVQYNPSAACGGSVVNIRNLATSALYRYTPYQPNAVTLAGGSDGCSAYGNLNFYRYFEDWFGGITDETRLSLAKQSIIDKYFEVEETLGEPVGSINCDIGRKDACVQAYENGAIIYTPSTGAWENYGEIRQRYVQIGSVESELGYPTSKINCNIGHKDACVQAYENGIIIKNPATGTWESYGEIKKRYTNNKSIDGFFGFPISEIHSNGNVMYQNFENGTIISDSDNNYWVTNKEIAKKYYKKSNILGAAIANINCNIGHKDACVQAYENGVIIYNKETGTWESHGVVRQLHVENGSVDGKYGFPIADVEMVDGLEKQKFQGGEL